MSRRHGPFATNKPWRPIGISMAVGLTVGAMLVGFVVLPLADRSADEPIWTAICTAFGLQSRSRLWQPAPPVRYASTVQWTASTVATVKSGNRQAGLEIAQTCSACHGDRGISGANWLPSLAGMPPDALIKQLVDYQSGHRHWAIMNAIAAALSPEEMRDVAAYYASLPAAVGIGQAGTFVGDGLRSDDAVVRLVYAGDPSRGLAPCASCHGLEGLKRAAPILAGQHPEYIERQLDAFRRQVRANDEGEQMRVVAAELSDGEIIGLADYLSRKAK